MSKTAIKEQPKERPIIFGAESIRSILEGRKTQTRRVVKLTKWVVEHDTIIQCEEEAIRIVQQAREDGAILRDSFLRCPFGTPGDYLWVREGFFAESREMIFYRATHTQYENDPDSGWKSPIFMPRWASRITLEITGVRVERLQEISEQDARAEGAEPDFDPEGSKPATCVSPEDVKWLGTSDLEQISFNRRHGYRIAWDRLNGKKHPWKQNPWAWVILFRRVN
jgi:hypothetical protein